MLVKAAVLDQLVKTADPVRGAALLLSKMVEVGLLRHYFLIITSELI